MTMAKSKKSILELKEFLDEKVNLYNTFDFIELDPISIPHQFKKKARHRDCRILCCNISMGPTNNRDQQMQRTFNVDG
jgi:hypothetical protein